MCSLHVHVPIPPKAEWSSSLLEALYSNTLRCVYGSYRALPAAIVLVFFTGVTNMLERVSPRVIILDPPEKLVIETRASGGYQRFNWFRNGSLFNPSPSAPFYVIVPREFPNFFEIFAREPTTTEDLGVYRADFLLAPGQTQVPDVEFVVTRYGKDHETSIYHIL